MIAINRHNFRVETVIEVGKFTILWNVFECEKCDRNCNNHKLKTLGQQYDITEHWLELACALQSRSMCLHLDTDEYVNKGLDLSRRTSQEDLQLIKDFIQTPTKEHLSGGLLAIYRIRNNMFHGLKDWMDLDNQIELFKAMNAVLESIS